MITSLIPHYTNMEEKSIKLGALLGILHYENGLLTRIRVYDNYDNENKIVDLNPGDFKIFYDLFNLIYDEIKKERDK